LATARKHAPNGSASRHASDAKTDTKRGSACSNLSKYPAAFRKAPMSKYGDLQAFCKLQNPLANYLAAFARRRAGVRIPSAPPCKMVVCR
jgi:hypothetical protein